jgi:2-succinyl-6-hydroxy-2,4-cyclohexadiene-1-carboxylate synthase
VAVDLPGHGGSGEVALDLEGTARAVLELAHDEPIDLIGYSLGARTALVTALAEPTKVRRLILISGTAGIEDDEERARRRAADDALADDLEASGDLHGFLDRWMAQPMFERLGGAANLEARLGNTPHGLATSLRMMGTGTMAPRWDDLEHLEVPTLVLAGMKDAKFAGLAQRLDAQLARSVFSLIPGANHACHLESPERVGSTIDAWLAATDASG